VLAGVTGVMLDERWFCSLACVERAVQRRLTQSMGVARRTLQIPPPPHLRLGVLLRHQGALSADQLHEVLERQRTSGLKIGAQARELYGIDRAHVLKALASQAGTRYLTAIDPISVHDAPGGLSREAVEALGLIPFSQPDEQGAVRVASTAPVHWDAVRALRQIADWQPELYLVEDDTWRTLLDHYGAGRSQGDRAAAQAKAVVVAGPKEAAARVANIAAGSRGTRLAEVRWEPYTLVRVESDRARQDVLFTREAGEEAWQAANTSR
jgi:hypothetical protein